MTLTEYATSLAREAPEHNPFISMLKRFDDAAERLGLDEGLYQILKHHEKELKVAIPIRMDDGTFRVFEGWRVQHNSTMGPCKGGIRYSPHVNIDEVLPLGRQGSTE